MKSTSKKILTAGILAAVSLAVFISCGPAKQETQTAVQSAESTAAESTSAGSTSQESGTQAQSTETTVPAVPVTPEETTSQGSTETKQAGHAGKAATLKILVASDIHYMAKAYRDSGPAFTDMVDHGDGRLVQYCSQITDAWKEEVIAAKPDLVILCGDLTFEGEKKSHTIFADILKQIEDAGIPVIVIPGNHDINNLNACSYDGVQTAPVPHISPAEFAKIYSDFGYSEAISRDPASLSYVYQADDTTRIVMLDSCQYTPRAVTGGMIREATYDWLEEQLRDAKQKNMTVITVTHQNVLDESEIYTQDCTIEHGERLENMIEDYGAAFHLSGHLHVQHYKKSDSTGNAFYEIVSASLTTPPCNYGILTRNADFSWSYSTKNVDVAAWADKTKSREKNLLNFVEYKEAFLKNVFMNQAYDEYEKQGIADSFSDADKAEMAGMYADLNMAYYAGKAYKIADEIRESDGYKKWSENAYQSKFNDYIESILTDATADYTKLEIPAR